MGKERKKDCPQIEFPFEVLLAVGALARGKGGGEFLVPRPRRLRDHDTRYYSVGLRFFAHSTLVSLPNHPLLDLYQNPFDYSNFTPSGSQDCPLGRRFTEWNLLQWNMTDATDLRPRVNLHLKFYSRKVLWAMETVLCGKPVVVNRYLLPELHFKCCITRPLIW